MNFKVLHEKFKDDDSPTVEGQIRWLQKQGFAQHQIEQAMLTVYSALERGETPLLFTRKETHPDGGIKISKVYGAEASHKPGHDWDQREIVTGEELDHYLLQVAKKVRTSELSTMVRKMEEFEANLRKKWEAEQKKKTKKRWWQR